MRTPAICDMRFTMCNPQSMNVDPEQVGIAFRRRLRELRNARGHDTDYTFALELGVNPSTMSTWMRSAYPRLDALVNIAQTCDVSLDWLAGTSDAGGPDIVVYDGDTPVAAVEVKTRSAAETRQLQQDAADGAGEAADAQVRASRRARGRRASGQ